MRPRFGIEQRLAVAFTLLVSTFGLASYLALIQVQGIRAGLRQAKDSEEGMRLSLELSNGMRDQYARLAHMIVVGDASHLGPYDSARRHVVETIDHVRRYATGPDERAWVDDVASASDGLDRVFRDRIVPAVLKRDAVEVQDEHGRVQQIVTLIEDRSRRLVDRFETSVTQARRDVVLRGGRALRWTLVFLLVAPLLATVVGVYVHRSVARPIAHLQAGTARIAQGDLGARIQIDTPDEFGDLARQFNAMTKALEEHQQRLVQHEKLAGIGRLAAGVAHEINNPLAVILGYARLLLRTATGQNAADLRIIEEESLRAKAIVDGLLELAGQTNFDRERVDLRALADEVIARLRGTGALEGVTVSVTGTATIVGSSRRLRGVVLNLLKNASEAAQPGGRIDVDLGTGPGFGRIVVRDTGEGLSHEAMQRVFEPFFSSKPMRTGLGLATSRAIVQAHGGMLEVENRPSGGASFEVRLPAVAAGEMA